MSFFDREYSFGRFVFVAVIANLLLYHYPFLHYVLDHLDFSNNSAYITLLCAIVALFGML